MNHADPRCNQDPITGLPVFAQLQVALACVACREVMHQLNLVAPVG